MNIQNIININIVIIHRKIIDISIYNPIFSYYQLKSLLKLTKQNGAAIISEFEYIYFSIFQYC